MLNTSKQESVHLFGDYLAESETSLVEAFMVGLPARRKADFQGVVHLIHVRCLPVIEVNPPGSPNCRCPSLNR